MNPLYVTTLYRGVWHLVVRDQQITPAEMSSPFMIVLRLLPGQSPLMHPSLVSLFDHARRQGHPLVVSDKEIMPGDEAGTKMIRLILRDGRSSQVVPAA